MLCVFPAWAQLNDNTITITASQSPTLAPDQVVFSIDISSGLGTGFDTVLNALAGSGITAANFTGASTPNEQEFFGGADKGFITIDWNFSWAVPLANMKLAVAALTQYQQNFSKSNQGLSLSFSVSAFQVSQQLQQAQICSASALFANATAQAQTFAAAAGLTVGPVVAISGVSSPSGTGTGCTMTVTFATSTTTVTATVVTSNSVTVAATRSLPSQADEAAFSISLTLPATSTLDNAVGALSGIGITSSNFASVAGNANSLTWNFNLVVPFSQLQTSLSALSGLQQKQIGNGTNTLPSLSFYQTSLQSSSAATCPYAGLVSDARAQAMNLAGTAGSTLGPIISVSDGSGVPGAVAVPYAVGLVGALSAAFFAPSAPPPTCTVTVQFQVSGSGATVQLQPGSITATGAVNTTATPDEVLFDVTVTAPITLTLNDVISELAGSGITAADLQAQSNLGLILANPLAQPVPSVSWPFTLAVPFSSLQRTISTLTALQSKLAAGASNMSFNVAGLETSPYALASQPCSPADVVNNARTKAQSIATASGLSLGPIVALSSVGASQSAGLEWFLVGSSSCTAKVKFAASAGQ